MVSFLKKSLLVFSWLILAPEFIHSQCINPSVNAQAGTGPSTLVCAGQCANLTATVVPPNNATTSYSVGAVTYSTLPYFGGSNAFATSSDDVWSDSISIGFNFCYFGNTYSKLLVGSNGEITFDLSKANQPESWVTTAILPNLVEHPGNTICGAYRDYDPFPGGVVRTYTTGTAPCRAFVAYWSSVTLFSCSTPLSSFQIVLYEGTNQIAVNIQNSTACMTWNNGRGLIGIQNANATQVVAPATRNTLTAWTAINESWRFVPTAAPSYSVNWSGPSGFTATGLTATPCPTTTSTYTATMSYCGGTRTSTVQVAVGNPTVTASASSNTVCPPGSATLTGSGATTYTWVTPTGPVTGQTIAVSPTINTTYTLLGTSASCTSSTTIGITVGTPPTVSAFNLSGTICPGGSANAVATGALTYTWLPGGITGNVVSLSPTVSTTYTVLGSSGGCIGTTTLLIPVGSSPTITAVSSPTSICVGSSATITASGATNYTWNPGALTGSSVVVSPSSTTVYTITGTSTLTCPGTQTITLVVNTTPTVTATSSPTSICVGSSATLTATGATTYTWNPGGTTGSSITVSPTVTTIYTVTGSNGTCTNTKTLSLTVNPTPTVTASVSPTVICAGSSATLTGSGAVTYTWNPGGLTGSTAVVNPTATTIYTLTGSNGSCASNATVSLLVNANPTITATSSPTSICSGTSATSTLSAAGALTYTWNPGAINGAAITVTPAVTTVYTVTGTNAAGCTSSRTVNVIVNTTPTVNVSASSSTICSGNSTTLTATGATTYTWNPGSLTGSSVGVSPASSTTYTVVGANGNCTDTKTINITVNASPTITALASPTSICSGSSSTLSATGATSYTWMPGSLSGGTVTVTPSSTTLYTVTGTNGTCSSTRTVNLIVTTTPTVTASSSSGTICSGNSVTLTATGATSYTWNPGALTGSNVSVSPATTTTYSVTGANGSCTDTKTITITVIGSPTLNATSNPTSICSGNSSTLSASGATSYTWNPGALTGGTVTVTPATTTIYTVTGSNGFCTNTSTVNLTVTTTPTITPSASQATICAGNSTTLSATGATSYTWNPGAITGSSTVVSPAVSTTYTVTGANGICSDTKTITITVNPNPTVTAASSATAICTGQTATLTASGATSYTWIPGSLTTPTIIVSPTVTTIYTLTGTNGSCSNTTTISLTVNPRPTVTATANPSGICVGGTSTLSASGALSYTWNPGATTGNPIIVSPGSTTTYTVRGVNSFGCIGGNTLVVTVNPTPTVVVSASPSTICAGSSSTLTATGATTYTWNPGAATGSNVVVSPTVSTTYTVIGDNSGCTTSQTISLVVNPAPTLSVAASSASICSGNSVTLTASGASSYTWNPGGLSGSPVTVSPASTTTYTLIGSNGTCTSTTAITVSVTPSPTVSAVATPTSLCAGNSATLTASGASSYTWNPGSLTGTNVVVSPTVTTTYTLTGANGSCSNTNTITLTVNPSPTITAAASSASLCSGQSTTLTATGGTSYTWNPGALTGATVVVTPTLSTTYTVTGTNGTCSNTAIVSVTVNPRPTVTATASPANICSGSSSTLSASGALSYTWNPGATTGNPVIVTPGSTTTYTVRGINSFGCIGGNTLVVTVNPNPTVTAIASPTSICSGNSTTLTATGATTYTWNPGGATGGSVVVSPTVSTTYTVTGDNSGCTTTQTVSVSVFSGPTVLATASPSNVCLGDTVVLTASGAVSYTWNPGNITINPVSLVPASSTVYTVTGSNGICSSNATVAVNVSTTPTITATSNPTAICAGGSATLSATGAATFTWNPGALTGTSVVVSPTTTTVYTITAVNGACSTTKNLTLTVNSNPTITVTSPTNTICRGTTATLTASGATSYTWMPGSFTGTSVAVSPTVTTIYTVTGTNAGGCSSTKTYTLNVLNGPNFFATATPTAMCSGTTATLIAFNFGPPLTYTWMPIAVTGSTVFVSPTVTTVYSVTATNGVGCSTTRTVNLVVNTTPTVVAAASSSTLCSGSSATLSATGATSYTWNPGAATGSSVVVTPTANTTYTVRGANGNCSNTQTLSITVFNTPTLTASASPTILCAGGLTTLTATGATSYTWMPPAITGGTVVVSPTVITVYTVTGTNGGVCSGTSTVLVNVNTPTITALSSPTSICIGSSATITANGASTYTWMPGAVTGSSIAVNPTVTTTYTIAGTNTLGCTGTGTVTLNVLNIPTITVVSTPTTVCAGSSATMAASGATSYTWNPGSLTGTSIVVTPTASTVYTVTGFNGACSNTGTISLNVNPIPTVSAVSSPTAICSGSSATLTGNGAVTYTWNPGTLTGTSVVVSPTATTVYTVTGADAIGCSNTGTVSVTINTPTITAVATPTSLCMTGTVALSASGASTYTWSPGAATGATVVMSPTVTTTYTVSGTNTTGCTSSAVITVSVLTTPTITAATSSSTLCSGYNATLTSTGALNYTWTPGGLTGGTVVVTPSVTTTYTVIGVNGSCAGDTAYVTINVTPSPAGVQALSTGTITCLASSANLFGICTSTNVNYFWNGPSSYTSSVQNPTGITVGGTYTLQVKDITTGCITTATTSVATNTAGPTVTLTSTGTITCISNTVAISVTSTLSGVTYTWNGPGSFTSTATAFTVTTGGTYTVNAFDAVTGCTSSNTVAAITDTYVAVTATITPATCTGSVTNNDGTITLGNFASTDKYDYVAGPTYTGTATYATASTIPVSGVITNTLVNPLVNTPYTVRLFGANGCFKDTTLILIPIDCSVNHALGLAKAVSTPTLNTNGTYDVQYKVVVKNTGFAQLNNVLLTENLSATFPAPTVFTVIAAPIITTSGTSLSINPTFDGSAQTNLTNTLTSVMPIGQIDTIVFVVNITPNGVFGTFNNSVLGAAVGGTASAAVTDSSQVGLNPDPDNDGNPTNNNVPTPLNLTPKLFFGLTKEGSIDGPLNDNSYDLTYTITVHNLGNDTLKNVTVKDSLFGMTIKNPATYTLKSGPTTTGNLAANSAFNGNSDPNLIIPANSKIAPNTTQTIVFTINVFPDTCTVFSNYATGNAIGSNSVTVSDTSNAGNNPDVNSNGIWNEPSDNIPTVLKIDNTELFVPEGFSPDGDGKNDLFVIKGLKGKECTITVYNRWGNKVYTKDNYDNSWNGTPNVNGTLGTQKLPQGTYYYILEFKNGDLKPMNGYIVLQY